MKSLSENSKLITLFLASRPKFLVASAAPVLVGSSLAYATTGSFNLGLFILALPAIMALQAGANITNDYFGHISGNDWANKNPTPFSGGRRFIQSQITVLLHAIGSLALTVGFIITGLRNTAVHYRVLSFFCLLILYQLYNRLEVVRCFYGRIAELALFCFVVVDRYVGVF